MKVDVFETFSTLLKQRSGLVLTPDKAYLLESRLTPIARRRNMASLDELAAAVRLQHDQTLLADITDAMTTNETSFFRDQKPFDQFRQIILPTMLASRAARKTLRIWSAACSSGQEAYSLAMLLAEESYKLAGWRIEIVGTDISREILERARTATYSQFEVQRGLPITLLVKYFAQAGDRWQLSQKIRDMVTFREFNLLNDLTSLGQFDLVFCRNVLIYFDQPTKTQILERMAKIIPADGILCLGGAETVLGVTDRFKPIEGQRGLYALASASAAGPVRQAAL